MATEFKLPEVSEGVESVDIAEILVAEGDTIDAGTIICEVETDKAVAEIECPLAGTISKILVSTGDSVDVGAPLILIEEGVAAAPAPAETAPAPAAAPAETPAEPEAPAPAAPAASAAPETIEFPLPEVSEGVETVDVAEMLVAVGDVVEAEAII
ncbi:MAG: hypothetical protein NXI04_29370, partial [Planctomycetaceae bacterium]|nr:hypothetical protein [Planctomycetaceae bacterium]